MQAYRKRQAAKSFNRQVNTFGPAIAFAAVLCGFVFLAFI